MRTLFNSIAFALSIALSASADRAHDVFEANKETILARPVTVCGDVAFSVGRANSPKNRGDAVGYTKAEEQAKWNLGEKHRVNAIWPEDVKESEKDLAWVEYRSQHPERFSVIGMQRIKTKKTLPDNYMVVLSFPADQVDVPAPTAAELQSALNAIRERERLAAEHDRCLIEGRGREPENLSPEGRHRVEADAKANKEQQSREIEKHDSYDENLML